MSENFKTIMLYLAHEPIYQVNKQGNISIGMLFYVYNDFYTHTIYTK